MSTNRYDLLLFIMQHSHLSDDLFRLMMRYHAVLRIMENGGAPVRTLKVRDDVHFVHALRQMFHLLQLDARENSALLTDERNALVARWGKLHDACYAGATLEIDAATYRDMGDYADSVPTFAAIMVELALVPNF